MGKISRIFFIFFLSGMEESSPPGHIFYLILASHISSYCSHFLVARLCFSPLSCFREELGCHAATASPASTTGWTSKKCLFPSANPCVSSLLFWGHSLLARPQVISSNCLVTTVNSNSELLVGLCIITYVPGFKVSHQLHQDITMTVPLSCVSISKMKPPTLIALDSKGCFGSGLVSLNGDVPGKQKGFKFRVLCL